MLSLFEKLINEHGSSTITKERLAILKDSYTDLEKLNSKLAAENHQLKTNLDAAQTKLKSFEALTSKYACDHCGSSNIKRTGNRPHPIFEEMGVKLQVFKCGDCNQETEIDPGV